MLKILVLQAVYKLSDDQTECHVRDRLSFIRFLGLELGDRVPDAKMIWLFRELLVCAKAIEKLFDTFDVILRDQRYPAMLGKIVDVSIVGAPKQRTLMTFVADRPGHDRRYAIEPAKAEADPNRKAGETFDSGLQKTIDWYLANEWWWRPIREERYSGARLGTGQA